MPPRKKPSKRSENGVKIPDSGSEEKTTKYGVTFVNLQLLTEDKKALSQMAEQTHDYAAMIYNWLDAGYKFSLSPDRDNAAFTASITGKNCIEENIGYCLSAKHGDPMYAVLCLYYKHTQLCFDGVFPTNEEYNRAKGDWE